MNDGCILNPHREHTAYHRKHRHGDFIQTVLGKNPPNVAASKNRSKEVHNYPVPSCDRLILPLILSLCPLYTSRFIVTSDADDGPTYKPNAVYQCLALRRYHFYVILRPAP